MKDPPVCLFRRSIYLFVVLTGVFPDFSGLLTSLGHNTAALAALQQPAAVLFEHRRSIVEELRSVVNGISDREGPEQLEALFGGPLLAAEFLDALYALELTVPPAPAPVEVVDLVDDSGEDAIGSPEE